MIPVKAPLIKAFRSGLVEPPQYISPGNPLAGLINQASSNPVHQPRQSVNPTPYTEIPNNYQQSNEAFLQALDPNFGRSSSAPIQEDWGQIQRNLAQAQKPVTYQQQVQQAQARQLAELQRQNQQAQLRLAEEQARTLRRQQRELAKIRAQATVNHRGQDRENGLDAIARGQRLSDKALKQWITPLI